jgi:phosphoglycerol transferase MdoB-like AlkP superfamily enzyme
VLLLVGVLAIARRSSYYEEREYYAINIFENTYDLMTQDSQEITQIFVAKQEELQKVYLRFSIEQLVDLDGRIRVSIVDSAGKTLDAYQMRLSSLTQTETADWTLFPIECTLEKGKTYTLRIQTSDVSGDGECKLYLSNNRALLFGNLFLNDEPNSNRLEATFKYNTYCLDDLAKMLILLLITAVLVCCSGTHTMRNKVDAVLSKLPKIKITDSNLFLSRLLFILTPFMAYYVMQSFSAYDLSMFLEQLFSWQGLFNLLLYSLALALFYLITNRTKYASILTLILTYILGLTNYFVWNFRGCPIVAADLASIKTASNVASNYSYSLGLPAVWATVLMTCHIVLFLSLDTYHGFHSKRRVALLLANALLTTGMWGIFFHSTLMKTLDISVSVWMPERNYAQNGSALSYLLTWTYYVVEKPEGYSAEKAAEIVEGYVSDEASDEVSTDTSSDNSSTDAYSDNSSTVTYSDEDTVADTSDNSTDADHITPNIIAIMNESFSDLAVDTTLETTEDYMPYIHNLTENTVKGNLYVSVLGGNTANSEFEFLTGNSLAFFPSRSIPYNSYVKETIGSLTWTLENQGYEGCKAIHPYYSDGWNRENVYPLLGFRDFITEEDFSGETYVRDFISDESDFERLIQEYEEQRAVSDAPFYEFSVTMQNHGGYTGLHGLTDENIKVTNPSDVNDQVTQYLNLIRQSDEAFQMLTEYFANVDEPTLIVMFGDHQPGFTDSVYDELMGQSTDTLGIEDTVKMYQTPYIIWANYDIQEETRDMSANYLSSYLLRLAGCNLTGYQKYLLDLMEDVPVLSAICYIGDDGVVHAAGDTSEYTERIKEYQIVQYNQMFDSENYIPDFFFLKE